MNIAQSIMYIFPQSVPLIHFAVQDDGPVPVLREGKDGRNRYVMKGLEDGETDEVEGIHYRYVIDYNRLTLGVDYDIVERGPYIAAWNLPEPQPTEEELLAAWEELQSLPPQPEPLTDGQRIEQLESGNTTLTLELAQTQANLQAQLDQQEQAQADLLLTLVTGGVL